MSTAKQSTKPSAMQHTNNSQRDAEESVKTVEQELIDSLNIKLEKANKQLEQYKQVVEAAANALTELKGNLYQRSEAIKILNQLSEVK